MFREAAVKLDRLEAEEILQRVNPVLGGRSFAAEQTTLLATALSFYPGFRLLELADHTQMPPRKAQFVLGEKYIERLDWTNGPIFRLNEAAPLRLDEDNVAEYVRFFFGFVRGRHGRFLVVESVDDIAWKDEPPPNVRKAIGGLIEPVAVLGQEQDGTFVLALRLLFKDSLFKGVARVGPKGQVNLEDEDLVVEDIPVLDDITGAA